ncbi:Fibrous Sheath-Interacting Protein 2 [Manis pentadactyla]|nr:Fibrous Sheath-Interacting Protein 2 [Manis pentadactyla]
MVKEISNSEFQPKVEEEVSKSELVLEAVKIMEKVVKSVDKFKSQEKSSSKKGPMLHTTTLEEALALSLAKIVTLPSVPSKDAKNLSRPELNKIAPQLTKSAAAEISKKDLIYKPLVHIFPSTEADSEPEEEEVSPDYEFVDAVSKLTDEIIKEISEHEIRLATAEKTAETVSAAQPAQATGAPPVRVGSDMVQRSFSDNPESWAVEDVILLLRQKDPQISGLLADIFREHDIDGKALLLLNFDVMIKYMGLKLGTALKLCHYTEKLQEEHHLDN